MRYENEKLGRGPLPLHQTQAPMILHQHLPLYLPSPLTSTDGKVYDVPDPLLPCDVQPEDGTGMHSIVRAGIENFPTRRLLWPQDSSLSI